MKHRLSAPWYIEYPAARTFVTLFCFRCIKGYYVRYHSQCCPACKTPWENWPPQFVKDQYETK